MKVLFVTHYAGLHGANLSLFQLIVDLRKKHEVIPLVLMPNYGKFSELLLQEGIPMVCSKFRLWQWQIKGSHFKNLLINFILNKLSLLIIFSKIKKEQVQLVHTNTSITPIGAYLADLLSVPHVWHVREFAKDHFEMDYVYSQRYIRKWFNKSSSLIVISNALLSEFRQIITRSERIKLIYNGLDFSLYNVSPNKKLQNSPMVFVLCGFISEGKNQMEIINSAKILTSRGKTNFKILLVGGTDLNDDYNKRLQSKILEFKLAEHVVQLDYTSNISEVYNQSDVGVLCSKKEGFGRVAVEYMFHYLPVIVSNTGALPELIVENSNGFLYELGNEDDLANKMQWMMDNRIRARQMGVAGRTLAIERFDHKRVANDVYTIMYNCVNTIHKN